MEKTMLVIEDYQPLLQAIVAKATKEGILCLEARSADEAIQMLSLHKNVSLIWLDHHLLGEGSGIDFLTTVRKEESYKKIPVIVVSNETNLSKTAEYESLGVVAYFSKAESKLSDIMGKVLQLLS